MLKNKRRSYKLNIHSYHELWALNTFEGWMESQVTKNEPHAPHLSPGKISLGYLDADGLWHREPSFPLRSSALWSEQYQPPSLTKVSSDSKSQAQMEETPEAPC